MEISLEIQKQIKEKREQLGLTISDLVKRTIPVGEVKPLISVSAISSIERGELKNIKQETFDLIAKALGLEISDKRIIESPLRTAFGACLWASPLLNAVAKEVTSDGIEERLTLNGLKLTCFADINGAPEFLVKYNQKPDKQLNNILTANETLRLLESETVDIAFLPVMTTEHTNGIVRIARCMNTVKGGVYLYVLGRKEDENLRDFISDPDYFDYEKLHKIKMIFSYTGRDEEMIKRCCFAFPKNSIAQIEIEQTLYGDTYYDKQSIEIKTAHDFENEIQNRITTFFKDSKAQYFIFAGWDYHIEILNKLYPKNGMNSAFIGKKFDGYRFTKYGHPFAQISYDCVMLENKVDYVKNHKGFKTLLNILSKSVKELQSIKHSNLNSRHRMIAAFLDMDKMFVDSVLQRINWEFLIYPEMYDKDLK